MFGKNPRISLLHMHVDKIKTDYYSGYNITLRLHKDLGEQMSSAKTMLIFVKHSYFAMTNLCFIYI